MDAFSGQDAPTAQQTLACVEEILRCGLEDWIQAAEVASVAILVGGATTVAGIRKLSGETIRTVLREGLMTAGDVTHAGFCPWNISGEQAIERIERDWTALGRGPNLGEICWLSNTPAGDARAKSSSNTRTSPH